MNLAQSLRKEIADLLSRADLRLLLIIGKLGKDTSIELMKIISDLDNSPESEDLYFAYHHPFERTRAYFLEIEKDIRNQYQMQKTEIDPDGTLEPLFTRQYMESSMDASSAFSTFLKDLSSELKNYCRYLIILLDPESVSDASKFNQSVNKIIDSLPENIRLILFEDSQIADKAESIKRRGDITQFRLPSTGKEIIKFMESAIAEDKSLLDEQRAQYLQALGDIYSGQNLSDKALPRYEEALKWYVEDGNVISECMILNSIGLMYYLQKKYDKAEEYYLISLGRSAGNNLFTLALFCADQLGRISIEQGKKAEALEFYKRGLGICDEAKIDLSAANILSAIGDLQLDLGKTNEAVRSFEDALFMDKKCNNYFGEARELNKLGTAYRKIGKSKDANDCQKQSQQIQKEKGFSLDVKK